MSYIKLSFIDLSLSELYKVGGKIKTILLLLKRRQNTTPYIRNARLRVMIRCCGFGNKCRVILRNRNTNTTQDCSRNTETCAFHIDRKIQYVLCKSVSPNRTPSIRVGSRPCRYNKNTKNINHMKNLDEWHLLITNESHWSRKVSPPGCRTGTVPRHRGPHYLCPQCQDINPLHLNARRACFAYSSRYSFAERTPQRCGVEGRKKEGGRNTKNDRTLYPHLANPPLGTPSCTRRIVPLVLEFLGTSGVRVGRLPRSADSLEFYQARSLYL